MFQMMAMAMMAGLCRSVMLQTADPLIQVRAFVKEKMRQLKCTFPVEVLELGKSVGLDFKRTEDMNPFEMCTMEEDLTISFRDKQAIRDYFLRDKTFFLIALAHEHGHIIEWEQGDGDMDPISYEIEMRRMAGFPDDYWVGEYGSLVFSEIRAWAQGYVTAKKFGVSKSYKNYAERIFRKIIKGTPPYAKEFVTQRIIAARKAMGYT